MTLPVIHSCFFSFLIASACTQPLQYCPFDDEYGGYKASLPGHFPLVFIIWQHSIFTPFLASYLNLYKYFLDSIHIFIDLDSGAYFPGYAKLRISFLPVYAILLNAISHFFFTGFVSFSTANSLPMGCFPLSLDFQ